MSQFRVYLTEIYDLTWNLTIIGGFPVLGSANIKIHKYHSKKEQIKTNH